MRKPRISEIQIINTEGFLLMTTVTALFVVYAQPMIEVKYTNRLNFIIFERIGFMCCSIGIDGFEIF
jgi:hypothetical protein